MKDLRLLLPLLALAAGAACESRSSADSQTLRMPATKIGASGAVKGGGMPEELLGARPASGKPSGEAGSAAPAPNAGAEGAAGQAPGGKNYEVAVSPPPSVKVGAQAQAQVLLRPQNGYKVNLEFPIRLKVDAPAGVKLAKATLQKADARVSEKEAAFQVAFTAENPGAKSFTGEFHFSVCTPKFCEIKKEKLAWSVAAE